MFAQGMNANNYNVVNMSKEVMILKRSVSYFWNFQTFVACMKDIASELGSK